MTNQWNKSKSDCPKSPICRHLPAVANVPSQAGKPKIANLKIRKQADSAGQIYLVFVQARGSHQG
ncbi:hypothetical protein [Kamptonema sp. UHCC 0994]|uniref:hypothetical protein n=1 Tax=Kamptonema sp. UHCC 0994 TaxID=3031329 RepID=UPI0023BA0F14|nr:hypothetical protein [Kamptonema sp. UHCC 0994]MDF0554491.1 hypothetical protein [Kamptonema sp. UHCC 0994]